VLQGLNTFQKGKTCIPWLGVKEGEKDLGALRESAETALEKIGYQKESRPFRPHMTFGRKVQLSFSDEETLQEMLKNEKVRIEVSTIAIMESTRINGELVYPVLEEIPL